MGSEREKRPQQRSATELGVRLGGLGLEEKKEVCSQPVCFPDRSGLWVSRRCPLKLGVRRGRTIGSIGEGDKVREGRLQYVFSCRAGDETERLGLGNRDQQSAYLVPWQGVLVNFLISYSFKLKIGFYTIYSDYGSPSPTYPTFSPQLQLPKSTRSLSLLSQNITRITATAIIKQDKIKTDKLE